MLQKVKNFSQHIRRQQTAVSRQEIRIKLQEQFERAVDSEDDSTDVINYLQELVQFNRTNYSSIDDVCKKKENNKVLRAGDSTRWKSAATFIQIHFFFNLIYLNSTQFIGKQLSPPLQRIRVWLASLTKMITKSRQQTKSVFNNRPPREIQTLNLLNNSNFGDIEKNRSFSQTSTSNIIYTTTRNGARLSLQQVQKLCQLVRIIERLIDSGYMEECGPKDLGLMMSVLELLASYGQAWTEGTLEKAMKFICYKSAQLPSKYLKKALNAAWYLIGYEELYKYSSLIENEIYSFNGFIKAMKKEKNNQSQPALVCKSRLLHLVNELFDEKQRQCGKNVDLILSNEHCAFIMEFATKSIHRWTSPIINDIGYEVSADQQLLSNPQFLQAAGSIEEDGMPELRVQQLVRTEQLILAVQAVRRLLQWRRVKLSIWFDKLYIGNLLSKLREKGCIFELKQAILGLLDIVVFEDNLESTQPVTSVLLTQYNLLHIIWHNDENLNRYPISILANLATVPDFKPYLKPYLHNIILMIRYFNNDITLLRFIFNWLASQKFQIKTQQDGLLLAALYRLRQDSVRPLNNDMFGLQLEIWAALVKEGYLGRVPEIYLHENEGQLNQILEKNRRENGIDIY